MSPIRLHDLRHTAASLWLSAGQNPKIVSEALGHAKVAITLDTYAHVIPSQRRALAEAMDAIVDRRGVAAGLVPAG